MELKLNKFENLIEKPQDLLLVEKVELALKTNELSMKPIYLKQDRLKEFFNKDNSKLFTILVDIQEFNKPYTFYKAVYGLNNLSLSPELYKDKRIGSAELKVQETLLIFDPETEKIYIAIDFEII